VAKKKRKGGWAKKAKTTSRFSIMMGETRVSHGPGENGGGIGKRKKKNGNRDSHQVIAQLKGTRAVAQKKAA